MCRPVCGHGRTARFHPSAAALYSPGASRGLRAVRQRDAAQLIAESRPMAAKKSDKRKQSVRKVVVQAPPRGSPGRVVLAAVLLLAATAAALALALEKIGGISLPGCGAGSPCAKAQASAWGTAPVIGWPVSFLGTAFFAGALTAWLGCVGRPGPILKAFYRLGAAVSVFYLAVIFAEGHLCPYCIAAHVANLLFWGVMEASTRGALVPRPAAAAAGVGVFVLATGALGVGQYNARQAADAWAREEAARSTQQIIQATTQQSTQNITTSGPAATSPTATTAPAAAARPGGFTGRYHYGPKQAPIRLVIMSDYQCSDCQMVEREVRQILQKRKDVSLSAKHFPFCTQCNPKAPNLHANACWAARAAEAAGMLQGDDGFWRMHFWLFDRKGSFTDAEIKQALPGLGFDTAEFLRVMQGDETLKRVQADIEEGYALGLYFTPMVFINGVEFRGWQAFGALTRAIDTIAATNPPAKGPEGDAPDYAAEKYVGDWRERPPQVQPPDSRRWTRGPENAAVRVVIFGDYQEPMTAELDRHVARLAAERKDVAVTFRHIPYNQECNPSRKLTKTLNPMACAAARAAEAAGTLGGADGYFRMHDWLLANQQGLTNEKLQAAAVELGFEAAAFAAAMQAPEAAAAIAEDAQAWDQLGLTGIPMIFVNDRLVPRWKREGDDVVKRIFEEAAKR